MPMRVEEVVQRLQQEWSSSTMATVVCGLGRIEPLIVTLAIASLSLF